MDKHDIARILDEIGTLLSLQGENPFKIARKGWLEKGDILNTLPLAKVKARLNI
jgi:hypothetical protein